MTTIDNRGIGIALLIIGALLLLGQFVNLGASAWPLFIIVPGVLLLVGAFAAKASAAPLAIPGSIVSTVGLILFYQNATGKFESWSYAWGLILAAVGVGIALTGYLQDNAKQQREGRRLASLGLVLFAAFGVFFELFVFRGFAIGVWRYLLPLVLIGGGLYLLVRQRTIEDTSRQDTSQEPTPQA